MRNKTLNILLWCGTLAVFGAIAYIGLGMPGLS